MIKKFLATLVASLSLFSATAAQAGSAQALSLSNSPAVARASSDAGEGNQLAGGNALGFVLLAVVLGGAIWGVIELVDDSDSN